ncbi:MAG: carbamoyl phosphate synthase small subunit, partial [Clostridia bacterium]|nr:carbamoyl phosphate synthase small subunit [Clostridia bacterium]
ETPSNFRCEGKLDDYLKEQGVVGIYGVDTRELTKILRDNGAMNAYIGDKPLQDLSVLQEYAVKNAVAKVTVKETKTYGEESAPYTVAFMDFGAKNSDIAELTAIGCKVLRVPADTKAEEIFAMNVDGVVLSAGPGNPAENVAIIEEIKKIVGKKPVFGVSLGYQMLALALGAQTAKMQKGHRGGQPVKALDSGRVYISSQNHGYVVVASSVTGGKIDFVNVNDGTCEGIDYAEQKAFGVQFDPSACSIASPSNILYDKFIANMKKEKTNA